MSECVEETNSVPFYICFTFHSSICAFTAKMVFTKTRGKKATDRLPKNEEDKTVT